MTAPLTPDQLAAVEEARGLLKAAGLGDAALAETCETTAPTIGELIDAGTPLLTRHTRRSYNTHLGRFRNGF